VCLVQRAEQRLRSGRVEEAEADVQTLLSLGLGDGDAYALLSTIQVVKNDKAAALDLATRATQRSPNSPRAWIALSYAHQAAFDLEKALASANKAAELASGSATAQARVAELLMSLGRIRDAEKAAKAAVAANPNESRAHMVLGFVHLAQIKTKAAREDFLNAIERDSTEPLARLGLGLAIIRDGDLKAGREQIEIAVALDPTNSLLRSYVGKAYYEENTKERDQLAATQFGIAKRLDPKDPTPHFYDAILKQSQNRPVEGLVDLNKSIELNDSRAVYRSRLLLDADRATRQISLAKIYGDLGAERAAVDLAASSVEQDPSNYSAHLFLSDLYAKFYRHEVARTSELLQALLLQPLNINPLPPQVGFSDLSLPSTTTHYTTSLNEYSSLFERNRVHARLGGLVGNQDTLGSELTLGLLNNAIAVSAGRFAYSTDGFRENADLSHEIYDVFVQLAISTGLSVQAEYRTRDTEHGDLALQFDPDFFAPDQRAEIEQDTKRLGLTYRPTPASVVLLSIADNDRTDRAFFSEAGLLNGTLLADDAASLYEGQYQYIGDKFNVILGGGFSDIDSLTAVHVDFTPGFGTPCPVFLEPCDTELQSTIRQANAYLYSNVFPAPWFSAALGLSRDHYEDSSNDLDEWNPKIGVRLSLGDHASIRAAAFRTLKRALITDQTVEPTHVMGFNQLFDDVVGSVTEAYAGATDIEFSPTLKAVLLGMHRDSTVSTGLLGTGLTAAETQELRSDYVAMEVNWIATRRLAFFLGSTYDRFRWDSTFPTDFPTHLDTVTVPLGARLFFPNGLFGEMTTTSVWQSVERQPSSVAPVGRDDFTVVDLTVGYRLPRRKGTVSLDVRNLFDTDFFYQDDNFRSTETRLAPYLPTRRVFLRALLTL
jgi:Tfp pilus assembly protein PilF